jgi:antitoxin ParD1/3/4
MVTMNISLDQELKEFADSMVASGMYSSHSEYVREMLRRDKAIVALDALLLEGLNSPLLSRKESNAFMRRLQKGKI